MGSEYSFLRNLEWRRAVKHFGRGEVDTAPIVRAIVNAPSSFGLQPFKVFAVTNKELKEKLRPVSFDQAQITECQTLFVFCARKDVEARAEEYLTTTGAEVMRGMLMGFLANTPDKVAWAARQTYIALGFALAACTELRISSCPMEGFMPQEVAKILELPENLQPLAFLAVGEDPDSDTPFPRFRFPESDLVQEIA